MKRHRHKTMHFINADESSLRPERLELPVHLMPEWRDARYTCDDPAYDMDAYPDDWLESDD